MPGIENREASRRQLCFLCKLLSPSKALAMPEEACTEQRIATPSCSHVPYSLLLTGLCRIHAKIRLAWSRSYSSSSSSSSSSSPSSSGSQQWHSWAFPLSHTTGRPTFLPGKLKPRTWMHRSATTLGFLAVTLLCRTPKQTLF